jgi:SAM-dependent methyltransferase
MVDTMPEKFSPQGIYDTIATMPDYRRISPNTVLWLDEFNLFKELLPSKGSVLDAGCGIGRDAKLFCQNNYVYTGVDISNCSLEIARSINPGVTFNWQDINRMPGIKDNSFDGLWAILSYIHFDPLNQSQLLPALFEASRVLKPKGKGFIVMLEGEKDFECGGLNYYSYQAGDFEHFLNMAGLETIICEPDLRGITENTTGYLKFFVTNEK